MIVPFHQSQYRSAQEFQTDLNTKYKGRGWYSDKNVNNTMFVYTWKKTIIVLHYTGTIGVVKEKVIQAFQQPIHRMEKP